MSWGRQGSCWMDGQTRKVGLGIGDWRGVDWGGGVRGRRFEGGWALRCAMP